MLVGIFQYNAKDSKTRVCLFENIGDSYQNFVGDKVENFNTFEEIQDYQKVCLIRLSTRIDNFQVHRIIGTTFEDLDSKETHYQEDKVDIMDPIIYFFREPSGGQLPGAFSVATTDGDGENAIELSKNVECYEFDLSLSLTIDV